MTEIVEKIESVPDGKITGRIEKRNYDATETVGWLECHTDELKALLTKSTGEVCVNCKKPCNCGKHPRCCGGCEHCNEILNHEYGHEADRIAIKNLEAENEALAAKVKSQAEVIRELREGLEFAREQMLPLLMQTILLECECGDDEQCPRCRIRVYADNTHDKAVEILDRTKGEM